jgi:hypothetical protein
VTRSHQFNSAFQSPSSPKSVASSPASTRLPVQRYVRARHFATSWMAELQDRFDKITALTTGWDGYNAKPVSFTCASFTAQLLEVLFESDVPPPQLVPGSDGTLQFEWHMNGFDLEVDVLAPYEVFAVRHDHSNCTCEEANLSSDYTLLKTWISSLSKSGLN